MINRTKVETRKREQGDGGGEEEEEGKGKGKGSKCQKGVSSEDFGVVTMMTRCGQVIHRHAVKPPRARSQHGSGVQRVGAGAGAGGGCACAWWVCVYVGCASNLTDG